MVEEACKSGARKRKACEVLGISLRTIERWQHPDGKKDRRLGAQRKRQPHKLTTEEKEMIIKIVNTKELRNLPVCKIVPYLADQGFYFASESSIYRILKEFKQLKHRQKSRPKTHAKPKACIATGPNQVWSWDISYLPTTVLGLFFYLYMILDIFSRKIVGWSIHETESANYGSSLIKQACLDERIKEDQLILHSDNGKPMKAMTMAVMLEKLGVTPSFSRPGVSDDNPFFESLFKTVKYTNVISPFKKFENIHQARTWMIQLVDWYNNS